MSRPAVLTSLPRPDYSWGAMKDSNRLVFRRLAVLVLVYSTVAAPAAMRAGDTGTVKYRLDAAALDRAGRLQQLRFIPAARAFELDNLVLYEDDAPAIGKPRGATDRSWFERLQNGIRIRKELDLEDARAFSGYLVFNGLEAVDNETPLHIELNGVAFLRPASKYAHPAAREYYTREWSAHADFDNWFRVEIPVGALKKGRNEIQLWADSESPSWEIMVASDKEYATGSTTRLKHPNRSAKSRDGGRTWDYDRLGWKDEIDGEYAVRLSLDRHVPEGTYLSPVIDPAEAPGAETVKRRAALESAKIGWDIELPEGTSAEIFAQWGRDPVPGSSGWSKPERVPGLSKTWSPPPGRYLQFRVVLKADNPLATPAFRGASMETGFAAPGPETGPFVRVVESRNPDVIRPSVAFTHEDFSRLAGWKTKFELDRVVAGAATEFEKQLRLMRWAYEVPIKGLDPYHWSYDDLPVLKKDAAGRILKDTAFQEKGRRREGHCLDCNLTLVGACLAMGYPARWVNIATMSTYGHEVAEVWSNDFDKWIFLDATRDYFLFDPETGIPLSLLEINERLAEIIPRPVTWEDPLKAMIPDASLAGKVRVAYREGRNRFSIKDKTQGPELLLLMGHLSLILRNDFASRPTPVPWRLSSNWGGPLFYGYFTAKFPRKREYALHTERWQDFAPPLNRTHLTLSETETPGTLRVDADTETPFFRSFLVRIDGAAGTEKAATSFDWPLHEGLNGIEVRARNSAGVTGPPSMISVVLAETEPAPAALTAEEKAQGWRLLFNGRDFSGWRGVGSEAVPERLWSVRDGTIEKEDVPAGATLPDGQPVLGGDLLTRETFLDFEFAFEWRVGKGANSGVKYNVDENLTSDGRPSRATLGFEYQVIDDAGFAEPLGPKQTAGSLYDLVPAKPQDAARPAGEWNASRIVFRGTRIEHWLNGTKVVDTDTASAAFAANLAGSKFAGIEGFARKKKGHLSLQDHNGAYAFRNLKIRELSRDGERKK